MRYKMHKTVKSMELPFAELRKMQMIILDNLIEFDRICRKYQIPYAIDGGTMLGAVRHKGFIPWDPDADIVIMRRDYERFKQACDKDLDKERFFLQDYKTDPGYRWGYARLLRNGTSYVRAGYESLRSRNGVFLDIFTMDSVPDNRMLRVVHRAACYCIQKTLWSKVGRITHPNILVRGGLNILSIIPKSAVFHFRDWLASVCNKSQYSELICHMCSPHPKRLPYGFPRKLFDDLIEYEFEGHMFLGFSDYDFYLNSIYGDYMTPPPESERTSHIPCSSYSLLMGGRS